MDSDNEPSTSKKVRSSKSDSANTMYPVTFEEFKKFVNVEDYVLKEMERAGPEIRRINYKIRHKYYPVVYKKFYASQATRAKMLRTGLTLKPIPKFLKDKLMLMPEGGVEAPKSMHKHKEKPPEIHSKTRSLQESSKTLLPSTKSVQNLTTEKNNKNPGQKCMEKENSPKHNLQSSSKKLTSLAKLTPQTNKTKGKPLAVDKQKITSFFAALALSKQSTAYKDVEQKPDTRKRKPDSYTESTTVEPQIKRLKDAELKRGQHEKICKNLSDLISNDSDTGSNLQIMIDNTKLDQNVKSPKKCTKKSHAKPNHVKKSSKGKTNKNGKRNDICRNSRRKSLSDDIMTDSSDVRSNTEIVDLTETVSKGPSQVCTANLQVISPLPRRKRTEDFKEPMSSAGMNTIKKSSVEQERNQFSGSDGEMMLLTLSGLSTPKVGCTRNDIHEWLEKGQNGLEDESYVEQNTVKYLNEEYVVIDRLKAINTYPEEVKKYIKYLLNLEIQKRKGTDWRTVIPQGTPKTKVAAVLAQMTFEDYKNLINAEKLITQKLAGGESIEVITANLKKQYEAITDKEKAWPKECNIKLSALKKYLQSKGINEPIHLKDIPPRILCFEEVLENTNIKECTSLSREKPPDSYKYLLELCKKEFMKCCEEGVWIDGMKLIDKNDVVDETAATVENLFSESMSMPPLRVHSSDLRNTAEAYDSIRSLNHVTNTAAAQEPSNEACEVPSIGLSIDSLEISKCTTPQKESNPEINSYADKQIKSPKRRSKTAQKKSAKQTIKEATEKSFLSNQEIETYLDAIFMDSQENNTAIVPENNNNSQYKTDHVPTDYNELRRTLAGDMDKETQPSANQRSTEEVNVSDKSTNALTDCLESSEGIVINDSPDSAGQLINNIIQPAPFALVKSSNNETLNASSKDKLSKPQNRTGILPPSPNLFQSSGESDPKGFQSQQTVGPAPEIVYLPCNHSVTFHTEENNLTALSIDKSSENQDPFAETSATQDETIIEERPETQDANTVVKQEYFSIRDAEEETRCSVLDDSVQFIDLPPSEPIVIEDEETAPDLLDMLLSRPTKNAQRSHVAVNLTCLSSTSWLENIPQAQQFPSNLSLTQSQSSETKLNDMSRAGGSGNVSQTNISKPIEVIKTDEEARTASLFDSDEIDIVMSIIKCESQDSNTIDDQCLGEKTTPTIRNGKQADSDTVVQANIQEPIEQAEKQSLEDTTEISYVSIAPQNIPSHIELTQGSTNKSNENDCGSKTDRSSSVLEISEDASIAKDMQGPIDQEISTGAQEGEASIHNVESIKNSQESCVSVYVYVTQEAGVTKIISHDAEVLEDVAKNKSLVKIEESSMENKDIDSSQDESKSSAIISVSSSNDVSIDTSGDLESPFFDLISEEVDLKSPGQILDSEASEDVFKNSVLQRNAEEAPADTHPILASVNKSTTDDTADMANNLVQDPVSSKDVTGNVCSSMDVHETHAYVNASTTDCDAEVSVDVDVVPAIEVQDTVLLNTATTVEDAEVSVTMPENAVLAMEVQGTVSSKDVPGSDVFSIETHQPSVHQLSWGDGPANVDLTISGSHEGTLKNDSHEVEMIEKYLEPSTKMIELESPREVRNKMDFEKSSNINKRDSFEELSPKVPNENNLENFEAARRTDDYALNTSGYLENNLEQSGTSNRTYEARLLKLSSNNNIAKSKDAKQIEHLESSAVVQHELDVANDSCMNTCGDDEGNKEKSKTGELIAQSEVEALEHEIDINTTGASEKNENNIENPEATKLTDCSKNVSELSSEDLQNARAVVASENTELSMETPDSAEVEVIETVKSDCQMRLRMDPSCSTVTSLGVLLGTMDIAMETTDCHEVELIADSAILCSPQELKESVGPPPRTETVSNNLPKAVNVASKLLFYGRSNKYQHSSSQCGDIALAKQTTADHGVTLHNTQRTGFCGRMSIVEQKICAPEQIEQPLQSKKQNTYIIPALLPLAAIHNAKTNEGTVTGEGLEGEDDDLVEVPFLINRRSMKSLPFSTVTSGELQQTTSESTIFTIKVNLEFQLEETYPVPDEEPLTADHEAQLSPTIPSCHIDEKVISDWLAKEGIAPVTATVSDREPHALCLRKTLNPQKRLLKDFPPIDDHSYNISSVPQQTEQNIPVEPSKLPPKQKSPPKTKRKKTSPKKSSIKQIDSGFVPQKTHVFRSLPLGTAKKPLTSKTPPPTTVEDIDYLIEDASQGIASSTASQILGTDCTYFESSQLLRNIDDRCVPGQPESTAKQQHEPNLPKVNILNRITMSEGIMARKVWQVNLQWKNQRKMAIEVRFVADKRSVTVCDESAKLLFNFSPSTWADVLRVLREIDHFEYKRIALKNCQVVTPLHKVLRSLFDSAVQVVNVKLINDSFNPYATCEKANPVYRKPFQCLTRAIPANILSRIKVLKEKLQNNNLDV